MINMQRRLAVVCRQLQFEAAKSMGVFWLIKKMPGGKIKEPWNKLYKKHKHKNKQH